ncbi:MAG: right-handed parallel beta-helix repeat-containing protein [Acidobacteriaceae bacterium]
MKAYQSNLQDQFGNGIGLGTITVYLHGTSTKATLYSDDGVTTTTNPIVSDSLGRYAFYVTDGRYDLTCAGSSMTPYTVSDVLIVEDPSFQDSIAAIKGVTWQDTNTVISTRGYYAPGDGGAGTYWWNSADTTADNGGTVIAPNAGGTGRWNLIVTLGSMQNAKQWGAKGDRATDDTAAIQAAINYVGGLGGGQIWFPVGTYVVSGLVLDWTHVLLIGETSGYDYEGQTTLAVEFEATAGTFAIHLKYDSVGGPQRKAFYSGLKDIAVNGTIEYGVLITSACTIMDNVTVNGFQYGITALGQNQNKYDRVTCTNNTKIGFCVLGINNLALTAPDLNFSDVYLVSSTIFTARDCNFRENVFGVFMRDGFLAEFKDCAIESNTQAGLMLYKPTGQNMAGLRFENCWLENNYTAYTSGSTSYVLTGITPMLATAGHFLTGSVSGDWASSTDAGYQLWIGSQTEDYASGGMDGVNFVNCNLNCSTSAQRYARMRSGRSMTFDGGF